MVLLWRVWMCGLFGARNACAQPDARAVGGLRGDLWLVAQIGQKFCPLFCWEFLTPIFPEGFRFLFFRSLRIKGLME